MSARAVSLHFEQGSLIVEGVDAELIQALPDLVYDSRTLQHRLAAHRYRELVLFLAEAGYAVSDRARAYERASWSLAAPIEPRPHQRKALDAWLAAGKRGVVSLPTGAGKTILAVLAIAAVERPSLVVVPTIDLLLQWQGVLARFFKQKIGALGGGERSTELLTVATYDSARLLVEHIGARFGLLIFDECHHLPAVCYQTIALASLAPFRLGLSATVERADGAEILLDELVGERVYEGQIAEMGANVLAPYDVVHIAVQLNEEEKARYEAARQCYIGFVRRQGISFQKADAWQQFIMRAARSEEGRRALRAYREQKRIAQTAEAKLEHLWQLINTHSQEAMIVFTDDNALAYSIGKTFMLPVLTHKTRPAERKALLSAFRNGELKVIVTSKVLNEGVDVPEARVGVVLSGSGTVREHVQRLGRILRHQPGKRAVLYELVSEDTSERYVNERRRQHHAYQRSP